MRKSENFNLFALSIYFKRKKINAHESRISILPVIIIYLPIKHNVLSDLYFESSSRRVAPRKNTLISHLSISSMVVIFIYLI